MTGDVAEFLKLKEVFTGAPLFGALSAEALTFTCIETGKTGIIFEVRYYGVRLGEFCKQRGKWKKVWQTI